MSDAPENDAPDHRAQDVFPEPTPVDPADDPDRLVIPAHVRTSPRFGRMIGTGVGVGIVAAMILALVLPNSTGTGRFLVFLLLALGLSLLGALIGGALATGLDRPYRPARPDRPARTDRGAQS
ncbi:hypothetical protein [Demequina lignilytica]|uniref:Uncharacterized protein n=1 Tax=Demequina lignilytica TaxID=3051663 RepID=A0AB35MHN8_9MICO|nr:hypothetical protein [Demequina sp. SYSU T0a273]MDN4483257.1 hypothetical protein [Demequina sp. SYSU T0a273]